jgi:TM2 domain-containing membrane protein YozV
MAHTALIPLGGGKRSAGALSWIDIWRPFMVCSNCNTTNDRASLYCMTCGKPLTPSGAIAQYPPLLPPTSHATQYPEQYDPRVRGRAVPVRYAVRRNPGVAIILSILIIGAGQLYNGDIKKGLVMFILAIVIGVATGGFSVPIFYIWSAVDAYRVASGKSSMWG